MAKRKKDKDKQRFAKHYAEKYRATRTPLKTGVVSGAPEGVSSSCSTSGTPTLKCICIRTFLFYMYLLALTVIECLFICFTRI